MEVVTQTRSGGSDFTCEVKFGAEICASKKFRSMKSLKTIFAPILTLLNQRSDCSTVVHPGIGDEATILFLGSQGMHW